MTEGFCDYIWTYKDMDSFYGISASGEKEVMIKCIYRGERGISGYALCIKDMAVWSYGAVTTNMVSAYTDK